jgi:hypothetical protein
LNPPPGPPPAFETQIQQNTGGRDGDGDQNGVGALNENAPDAVGHSESDLSDSIPRLPTQKVEVADEQTEMDIDPAYPTSQSPTAGGEINTTAGEPPATQCPSALPDDTPMMDSGGSTSNALAQNGTCRDLPDK